MKIDRNYTVFACIRVCSKTTQAAFLDNLYEISLAFEPAQVVAQNHSFSLVEIFSVLQQVELFHVPSKWRCNRQNEGEGGVALHFLFQSQVGRRVKRMGVSFREQILLRKVQLRGICPYTYTYKYACDVSVFSLNANIMYDFSLISISFL